MIPFMRLRESVGSFLAEYLGVVVIMGRDDLIPGANCPIGGLFGQLLCYGGFHCTSGVVSHDAKIQLLPSFKEGLVLDRSPHSCNLYRAHWFPRCYSFGANDNRSREHASCPIGVSIRCCEPWVSEDEVIQSHVSNIETEKVRNFSGDDFKFGVIFQAPSGIWGSVGVLEFLGVFHKAYPQLMLIDKALTNEAFRGSTVKEGNIVGLFLCGV